MKQLPLGQDPTSLFALNISDTYYKYMASSKISVKINMFYTIISYVDLHLQHHLMSLGIHYRGSGPMAQSTNGPN